MYVTKKISLNTILLTLSGVTGFNMNLKDIDIVLSSIEEARHLADRWNRQFHNPYLKVSFALTKNFNPENKEIYKIKEDIKQAISKGVDIIEIAPYDIDEEILKEILDFISEVSEEQFISMRTNRQFQSNAHLVNRTKDAFNKFGKRLLLNVDGASKQNDSDRYEETIQTIATADILIKDLKIKEKRKYKKLPVYLSGDINKKTTGLAKLCGIDYCGLSVDANLILSLASFDETDRSENFFDVENRLSLIIDELEYFKNIDRKNK